jgi:hypothetical protein
MKGSFSVADLVDPSHFFNSAVQFMITVHGAAFASPLNVPIRNL